MRGIGNGLCFVTSSLATIHIPPLKTVAGRTLLHTIIRSLERIAFNDNPLKLLVVETTYQPFISLFHQLDMFKNHPQFEGIRAFFKVS